VELLHNDLIKVCTQKPQKLVKELRKLKAQNQIIGAWTRPGNSPQKLAY